MSNVRAKDVDLNFLLSEFSGYVWATEFCKLHPSADFDLMLSWFCCAIMTGYDIGQRDAAAGIQR